MSRYISDENKVLFVYESGTYASASGTGQWVGLVSDHTLTDEENVQQIRYVGTGTRNVDLHVNGALDHNGTITYNPQDWKFLGFALGSIVDSGSPSPYQHDLVESNSADGNAFTAGSYNPFFSFTIEDSQGGLSAGENFIRTIKGCMVDSFELKVSQGDIAEVTVNYKAQSVSFSSGTSTSVTSSSQRPFLWQDFKVNIPSGTAFDEVKDMTLSVNNNITTPHYLNGSRVTTTPLPMNREYSLDLTIDGTSQRTKTLYDQYFKGGSEFNVFIEGTDASAGAGSRSIFISCSGCRLTEMSAPTKNEDLNEQTITIVPKSVSAVVVDTIQNYNPY